MSDPKAAKGWLGSKRRVLCGYCKAESRLDNLSRHTLVHGKDLPLKYETIVAKNNVKSFFLPQTKPDYVVNNNLHEKDSNKETDAAEVTEKIDVENKVEINVMSDDNSDDIENDKPSLKRKPDNFPVGCSSEKIVKVDSKVEFENLGYIIINKVNERFDGLEKILSEKNVEPKKSDAEQRKIVC